jgi:hypothetical protein
MTIDNHCGRDDQMSDYPGSQAEAHSLIALEQSALYAARLAIARWINTSSEAMASIDAPQPALARAAWYAQAQRNFQEWLGRGGFAQYDIACAEHADPVSASALDSEPLPATRPAPTCIH